MIRLGKTICALSLALVSACAHGPRREQAAVPDLNLKVYRIEIGRKSSPTPIAELFMPTQEFQTFLATRDFRDRDFRRNTFYNGCYLFEHKDYRSSRGVASQKPAGENSAESIFCYDSALDRFHAKSALLP